MASPERLDAAVRLVGRPQWLILATVFVGIVVAGVWAVVAQVPIKVAANGILIHRAGLVEIVAGDSGMLQTLSIAPGDVVQAGQVVATLGRSEMARQLTDAEGQLAAAEERLARLKQFYDDQEKRESAAERERRITIQQTQAALRDRLKSLEEKEGRVQSLVDKGLSPRDTLIQTQIEIADTRERLSSLGDDLTTMGVTAAQRQSRASLAILDEQRNVDDARRTAERLRSNLAEEQSIRATGAGQVVEVRVSVGDVVASDSPIATLTPVDHSDAMQALLYVPAADGKRIRAGMPAEIVPSTVERERYGHMIGEVASVAPLPATAAGMRRVLRNDELVTEMLAGGAPIEVRVDLRRDPGTHTGFAWSSSRGPSGGVSAGTLVGGRVVVGHQLVVGFLVPRVAGSED